LQGADSLLIMEWENHQHTACLKIDFETQLIEMTFADEKGSKRFNIADLLK
jgi:sucrose phosphorylase